MYASLPFSRLAAVPGRSGKSQTFLEPEPYRSDWDGSVGNDSTQMDSKKNLGTDLDPYGSRRFQGPISGLHILRSLVPGL